MGHWMIRAGALARVAHGRWSGSASLGYGGTVNGEGHAKHGGGVWPPMAPMNGRELEGSLQAQMGLGERYALLASLSGAHPIGDGLDLALAEGGGMVMLDRFMVSATIGHGLLDHPTALRTGVQIMASF
jgi:hypothetical protein